MSIIKGKILLTRKNELFFSKGLVVYKNNLLNGNVSKFFVPDISIFIRIISKFDFLSRLFRISVHHMVSTCDGNFYILYCNKVIKVDKTGHPISFSQNILSKRPLCIVEFKDDLYYGQYFDNSNRLPVNLYKFDGFSIKSILQFEGVRHIHGVFVDPYDQSFYVTTGDYGFEACIWAVDIINDKKVPILSNSQQSRAVSLEFCQNYIYFGTDSPLEQNYLYKIDKKTYLVEQISSVDSSIFYSQKINNKFYFSNVIEPSEQNDTNIINIYELTDNDVVTTFCISKKDFLPLRYFQYGQIIFAHNCKYNPSNDLWFYHLATKKSGFSIKL